MRKSNIGLIIMIIGVLVTISSFGIFYSLSDLPSSPIFGGLVMMSMLGLFVMAIGFDHFLKNRHKIQLGDSVE